MALEARAQVSTSPALRPAQPAQPARSLPPTLTMRHRIVIFSRSRRSCATSAGCAFSMAAYLVHSSS